MRYLGGRKGGESEEGCVSGLDILIKKIMDTTRVFLYTLFSRLKHLFNYHSSIKLYPTRKTLEIIKSINPTPSKYTGIHRTPQPALIISRHVSHNSQVMSA